MNELNNIFASAIAARIYFQREAVFETETHILLLHSLTSNMQGDLRDPKICLTLHLKNKSDVDHWYDLSPIKIWGSITGYDHEESMAEATAEISKDVK